MTAPILTRQAMIKASRAAAALLPLLLVYGVTQAVGINGAACVNHSYPSSRLYLPDCRGYELVSPPYKESMGVGVDAISTAMGTASPQLLVRSFGAFSGLTNQPGLGSLYTLERSRSTWVSTPLDIPFATMPVFDVEALSPDFGRSLWVANKTGILELEDFYLREPGGTLVPVGPGTPKGATERVLNIVGASDDLSHIIFQAFAGSPSSNNVRLWPGDKTEGENESSLYEYTGTNNTEPRLVGVSNEGRAANIVDSHLISQCGTYLGSADGNVHNAMSRDGSRVFFTALGRDSNRTCGELPPGAIEPEVTELYARSNGSRTVSISEPDFSSCDECNITSRADAQFRGASFDGSRVFFTTTQHLLPTATGEGANLYEYNFDAPSGHKVTLISSGDPLGAQVRAVAQISDDGSHVYFVAHGVLTREPNTYGITAQDGAENLYVSAQDCSSGDATCSNSRKLSFIGRFLVTDNAGISQTTPDGRFIVFRSAADLTPDEEGREEAGQIFEYDAQTGALVRVSRGERGYNEDGNSRVYSASIPTQSYSERYVPTGRYGSLVVSADGTYVVFTSKNGLTPQATTGSRNVYEYHNGEVALISGGHDFAVVEEGPGVTLMGMNGSGSDIFFTTTEQLVPQDTDTQQDIYDARIGGGRESSVTQATCSDGACHGAGDGSLSLLSPGTSTVMGEGDNSSRSTSARKQKTKIKIKRKKRKHKRRKTSAKLKRIVKKR